MTLHQLTNCAGILLAVVFLHNLAFNTGTFYLSLWYQVCSLTCLSSMGISDSILGCQRAVTSSGRSSNTSLLSWKFCRLDAFCLAYPIRSTQKEKYLCTKVGDNNWLGARSYRFRYVCLACRSLLIQSIPDRTDAAHGCLLNQSFAGRHCTYLRHRYRCCIPCPLPDICCASRFASRLWYRRILPCPLHRSHFGTCKLCSGTLWIVYSKSSSLLQDPFFIRA